MPDDDKSTDTSTGTEGAPPNGDTGTPPATGSTTDTTTAPATGKADGDGDSTDWKAHSRKNEDRAKANKAAADAAAKERDEAKATLDALRKALDPNAKDDEDPSAVATRAITERDQTVGELRAERLERAAEKAARRLKVDEVALLDSRGFVTALAKLDPKGDGFAEDLEAAVNAAVGSNPRLKVDDKPTPPPPSTADMGGGGEGKTGAPKTVEEARAARRKRRTG